MGQVGAHIGSEEIPQLLGTQEISSVLGQLAAYITSEDIPTVAGKTEEISSKGGAVSLHILQVRKFPQLL